MQQVLRRRRRTCCIKKAKYKSKIGMHLAMLADFGGGRWIRTTEGIASRFTVCPLWPLGKSPKYMGIQLELVDGFEPPTC